MRLATGSSDIDVKLPVATSSSGIADKPPLHHLHRFRRVAYNLIPKQQRMDAKMGARPKECMMLGYVHNTTKIWKIWDPEQMDVTQCSC